MGNQGSAENRNSQEISLTEFTSDEVDKVGRYCDIVLKVFSQYYLLGLRQVALSGRSSESPPAHNGPSSITVPSFQTYSQAQEPYTVYEILTRLPDERVGLVFRRYHELTELQKALKTNFPKLRLTPLGGQQPMFFNQAKMPQLVEERKEAIQKYLGQLAGEDTVMGSRLMQEFLGLTQAVSPLVRQAFEFAFTNTRTHFGVSETAVVLLTSETSLSKLLCHLIVLDEFWSDRMALVQRRCSSTGQQFGVLVQALYSELTTLINVYSHGALDALQKQTEQVYEHMARLVASDRDSVQKEFSMRMSDLATQRVAPETLQHWTKVLQQESREQPDSAITLEWKGQRIEATISNPMEWETLRRTIQLLCLLPKDVKFHLRTEDGKIHAVNGTGRVHLPQAGLFVVELEDS